MERKLNQRACGYIRVSTLLGQDPEIQKSQIQAFANGRGLEIATFYIDRGISGAKEKRPALDQMIKDGMMGKYSLLIIVAIDRLARDTRHLLNLINELNHYKIAIISLRENIDFSSPMGQATLTIIGAVAKLERELIRERIRNALAAKKLAAQQSGSGWRCGRPQIINQDLISKVLALRALGRSIREISNELNVGKSTVQRILADPKRS